MQHELDPRIALVIAGERRRYERRGQARRRADRQTAAPHPGEIAHLALGPFNVGQDAPREGEQGLACRRQRYVAPHAMEQWCAELILQPTDLLGDRGLGYRELARRFREVPLLGDGDEIPQLVQLHLR